jgi:hypothetical protein
VLMGSQDSWHQACEAVRLNGEMPYE